MINQQNKHLTSIEHNPEPILPPLPKINMDFSKAEVGDGVDYGAAGVKDLNNFKGYHNQEAN
jgi:hypothetical protein